MDLAARALLSLLSSFYSSFTSGIFVLLLFSKTKPATQSHIFPFSQKQNRAALLQLRKSDPAVLVDIPQGPSVEDFAAAGLLGPDPEERKVGVAS